MVDNRKRYPHEVEMPLPGGPLRGSFKLFGDMTSSDLQLIADELDASTSWWPPANEQDRRPLFDARVIRELADQLFADGVARVGDLDRDVVAPYAARLRPPEPGWVLPELRSGEVA